MLPWSRPFRGSPSLPLPGREQMTVLHLISSEGFYGAESMLVLLGRNLTRLGWRSIIGVFRDERSPHLEIIERTQAAGLPAQIIPCAGRVDWSAVRHIRSVADAAGIDVLHTHGYKTNLYGYSAVHGGRAVLVSTCHGLVHDLLRLRAYAALDRLVLRRFDRVAAVSDALAGVLTSSGVEPAKVATISNGVDLERFRQASPRLREELARPGGPVVGLVGRLEPGKGGHVLLCAAVRVLAEFPDTTFVLVGGGPCRAQWESLAVRLGVARSVIFTGVRDDMPEIYASLDIMALPSFNEGMPMCLLEAMAAGCPVIATPVGSVDKLIRSGHTGLMVQPGDANGLAEAILLLLRSPARARALGENGRAHVAANFSPEAMAGQYSNLYQEALRERASCAGAYQQS